MQRCTFIYYEVLTEQLYYFTILYYTGCIIGYTGYILRYIIHVTTSIQYIITYLAAAAASWEVRGG